MSILDRVIGVDMSIEVMIKSVYGEYKVYPVCDKSKMFASIACTTTLTHHTLSMIEKLGYVVNVREATPKTWRGI